MSFAVRFLSSAGTDAEPLEVRVEAGSTLIEAVGRAGLPLAQACGRDGLCGRCGVVVLEGSDSLSAESAEEREAKRRNRVDAEERLACLARVRGPVVATARYW